MGPLDLMLTTNTNRLQNLNITNISLVLIHSNQITMHTIHVLSKSSLKYANATDSMPKVHDYTVGWIIVWMCI